MDGWTDEMSETSVISETNESVGLLISELENYLHETELPDADYIAEWNKKFNAAAQVADRGPGWEDVVKRAHALEAVVQNRVKGIIYERDQLRQELSNQASGQRALKGYSSGVK